ncbi:MAG: hypothetical protein EHM23_17780 [Acidobacteria bacterium]|nr:MAG: hypothetical protein EHM23_17780 [Acidobacteriota bacterium]
MTENFEAFFRSAVALTPLCVRRPCRRPLHARSTFCRRQGRRTQSGVRATALRKKAVAPVLFLCLSTVPLFAQQRPDRDEAVSLAIAGEYQRAYNIFRELLHDAPDDPLLNYYTGAACVRMNREAEGAAYLEKAVRQAAPFPQAYQELAEAYLKKKLDSQARDVIEKGLKRFPKNQGLQKLRVKTEKLKADG